MVQQSSSGRPVQMLPVDRPTGQNDVGIVAWLLTLKTPECPQGRQARLIPFPASSKGSKQVCCKRALPEGMLKRGLGSSRHDFGELL